MATYKIHWKKSAVKELKKLERAFIPKILEVIENLAENPYPAGTKKLQSSEHTYRLRVGDYRVVYSVKETQVIIEIIRIGHRKDIYKGLK